MYTPEREGHTTAPVDGTDQSGRAVETRRAETYARRRCAARRSRRRSKDGDPDSSERAQEHNAGDRPATGYEPLSARLHRITELEQTRSGSEERSDTAPETFRTESGEAEQGIARKERGDGEQHPYDSRAACCQRQPSDDGDAQQREYDTRNSSDSGQATEFRSAAAIQVQSHKEQGQRRSTTNHQ
jgi:hypothetical protein